jgi:hypothetical protein
LSNHQTLGCGDCGGFGFDCDAVADGVADGVVDVVGVEIVDDVAGVADGALVEEH